MIKEAVDDKLILPKLHFFKCTASHLQPFLANYQTDKPMVCFLATDLSTILRGLMRRFIKDDVLSEANTVEKRMVVNVQEKSNHRGYKKIEIGLCTESALKDARAKAQNAGCSISDKELMAFRLECRSFLIAVLMKLMCPLSYSLVRNMVALDPREMVSYVNICRAKFKRMLTVLVNSNKLRGENSAPTIGADMFSSFLFIELMIFFYPHDM